MESTSIHTACSKGDDALAEDASGSDRVRAAAAQDLVLVVDDDDDIRDAFRTLLESDGFEVVEAADGEDAMALLQVGLQPCLVLLDLMMPRMDGLTFLRLRDDDPALRAIPVILVTASGRVASETADGAPVLHKPLGVDELLGAVRKNRAH